MDKLEARRILSAYLAPFESRTYDELAALVESKYHETIEAHGESGTWYQIELQAFWDDKPGGAVRILGSIDDGGIRAFFSLCDDVLVFKLAPIA